MRLSVRLALVLTLSLVGLLCAVLGLWYRGEVIRLGQRRDEEMLRQVHGAARYCETLAGAGFELGCLGALKLLAGLVPGNSFRYAELIEPGGRILLRVDAAGAEQPQEGFVTMPALLLAAGGVQPIIQQLADRGQRAFSAPLSGDRRGALICVVDSKALNRTDTVFRRDAFLRVVQALAAAAAAALLLSVAIAGLLVAPLRRMAQAARHVAEGRFAVRLPASSPDELGQLAREFNQMAERLAEVDRMKESFLEQVTHDLRNPLNAIVVHAELLAAHYKGPVSEEQAQSLAAIASSGRDLTRLVNDILEVTRLEGGHWKPEPEPIDLAHAMESLETAFEAQFHASGVSLCVLRQPELEQVFADSKALLRILTNLVANAFKFTPAGGSVQLKARRGRPNEVLLVVSDTGAGIPKERQGQLFAKFSQVPETRASARVSGSGLGLYISRQLIEAMGGRIWVESALGQGSSFFLSLPERPAPVAAPRP